MTAPGAAPHGGSGVIAEPVPAHPAEHRSSASSVTPWTLVVSWLLAGILGLGACSRDPRAPERTVVLYSSVDDHILRPIVERFERRSGIRVLLQGDTEATKTTALVLRLLAEREKPRADVWWSNEPLGTIRLAREGLLEPGSAPADADFPEGWPAAMRDAGGTWHGFASRARVIVYNTQRVAEAPRTLEALADPAWKGRVGMARPQFGTTRAHMAALVAACGPEALRSWLVRMKANGLRLYDGNSTVVRAVAQGEIDIGLTDTDDVFAGLREGWPVAMAFEEAVETPGLCSRGPLLLPNTAGILRGAPHPREARELLDYILSAEVERLLAEHESRHIPVRPLLAAELDLPRAPRATDHGAETLAGVPPPSLPAVADAVEATMAICREVLGE